MAITKEKRKLILNQRKRGKSLKTITRDTEVSLSTVKRMMKREKEGRSLQWGVSSGRHRRLSPREERILVRKIVADPFLPATSLAQQLSTQLQKKVSVDTVRRTLGRNGFKARKPAKKPFMGKKHRQDRLSFAKKYADQPSDFWEDVIFSDETPFQVFPTRSGQWTWRRPNERFQPNQLIPTVKHGGGSLQVWGCMSGRGIGFMCKLPEGLDAKLYLDILNDELQQTRKLYFRDEEKVLFQHDGASPHTARVVRRWFEENEVDTIAWPAQSPDLNPIENLWGDLKRRIMRKDKDISSKERLWEAIQEEWEATDVSFLKSLVRSMPNRLKRVIKEKGGPIPY